ncbi:MAG: ABC transporter ATP-binding protein [Flavobacteriaceae bacterium]|nr:ABC transporter ATP-binding protein [Flavobacteriaceae bacterium]MDH3796208.1 ABC transporter ATP-binding protein [Flavobacteriaceae bacterium]
MIQISNLHKSFKKNHVLKGIDLDIDAGGIYAILGPNGSGKTTMIKSILGMIIPDEGNLKVDGEDIHKQFAYRQKLNYLPQIADFPGNLKVNELIRMIIDLREQTANHEPLLETFGLNPYLEQKLSTLSGGSAQKVNLVLTFMFDNPIYILDEPTTGLDPNALIQFKGLLRKERDKGKTILITTHIMSFVDEVADEIIYLLEGRIGFKGSIDKLLAIYESEDIEHAIADMAKNMIDA